MSYTPLHPAYFMRFCRHISAALLLLLSLGAAGYAADLKIVVLDSKDGHPLRSKLVCVTFPTKDPIAVNQPRMCNRTDTTGAATFLLPDPAPESVKVDLASNNLVPCFASQAFSVAVAMKDGLVAKNTCGGGTTDTTETKELVVYGHQKGMKEVLGSTRDEF